MVRGRFRANASVALEIFVRHPRKTFSTLSANTGHQNRPQAALAGEGCGKVVSGGDFAGHTFFSGVASEPTDGHVALMQIDSHGQGKRQ
jgi:hypothetical protein